MVDDQASAGSHGADSSHIDFSHHKPPSPSVLVKYKSNSRCSACACIVPAAQALEA